MSSYLYQLNLLFLTSLLQVRCVAPLSLHTSSEDKEMMVSSCFPPLPCSAPARWQLWPSSLCQLRISLQARVLLLQREGEWKAKRGSESRSKCLWKCEEHLGQTPIARLQPLNSRRSPPSSLPLTNGCRVGLLPLNEMPVLLGVMTERAVLVVVQEN